MKMLFSATVLTMSVVPAVAAPYSTPVPATFESRGKDRKAITALLDTYAKAVSTKDQALFETLLLDKTIPFSGVPLSGKGHDAIAQTSHYDDFRKGVFEGEPFIQTFRNIQIHQDGTLAQVSLVFENATATEKSWGWKTMELLKVDGRWKIAAEFFTGHR
jgi:ketosteroid isomerase-like protein